MFAEDKQEKSVGIIVWEFLFLIFFFNELLSRSFHQGSELIQAVKCTAPAMVHAI